MARRSRISNSDMYMDVPANVATSKVAALKADAEYIARGNWKCGASPCGAHHWIRVTYNTDKGLWHCIHCKDFRVM